MPKPNDEAVTRYKVLESKTHESIVFKILFKVLMLISGLILIYAGASELLGGLVIPIINLRPFAFLPGLAGVQKFFSILSAASGSYTILLPWIFLIVGIILIVCVKI